MSCHEMNMREEFVFCFFGFNSFVLDILRASFLAFGCCYFFEALAVGVWEASIVWWW